MDIKRSKFGSAISVSIGPFIIIISQFIQLRDKIYYPIILLIISTVVFIIAYIKTPKYYVKETSKGILITGSKQGFYDPDFIEFSQISNVEIINGSLFIGLNDSRKIEIFVPKKYRKKLLDELNSRKNQ